MGDPPHLSVSSTHLSSHGQGHWEPKIYPIASHLHSLHFEVVHKACVKSVARIWGEAVGKLKLHFLETLR